MTTQHISQAILQAINLQREIDERTEALDAIKKSLRFVAEGRLAEELGQDATLPGNSYTFAAEDGSVATVSFPKPGLIRGFTIVEDWPHVTEEKAMRRLPYDVKELCGLSFKKLFDTTFVPVKAFRDLVPALLGKSACAKVLEACQVQPGAGRVAFKVSGKKSAPPSGADPS